MSNVEGPRVDRGEEVIECANEYVKKSAELSGPISRRESESDAIDLTEAHDAITMAADYIKAAVELTCVVNKTDGIEPDALNDALDQLTKANEIIRQAEEVGE